ncbi:serine/threonine-protein phosphatase 6 regulatory ankyrin repeat subunit B-like isoform X2 [Sitophilus oryzae]|uniref:Serine/threonine-protein phosphatase 6 regulatory ankyrin repeat subunit B-like isoform X2 n=1 Tax=Sitophilus oryzae TaxID=7048 RepID=A0A6J2YYI1_SITOR|nr:serine/threonine-protein phosphatase 6 regulatory ankyrin repeat subunit B-like isoform X2 [Sitophilus oryzae]
MSESDSGKDSPCLEFRPKPTFFHPKILDNDRNTALHYAAARGDDESVVEYLEKNSTTVDPENYLGWTPLMMACRRGHLSTVKILLDYRANATLYNKYDMNVLHLCIASGNLKLVELMLEHLLTGGISRRILERNFSTISLAILFQHHSILEFLMKKEFVIDLPTEITKITPLMFAQAIDNSPAISLLLQNKADTKTKNYLGHTAVDIAIIRQQLKFINPDHKFVMSAAQIEQQQQQQSRQQQQTETQNQNLKDMLQGKGLKKQVMLQPSASVNQVPVIMLTPEMFNSPMTYVASPNLPMAMRKSSNVSPMDVPPPPPVTPITPMTFAFPTRQVFFPPEFSPCGIAYQGSSVDVFNNDLLNSRINSSTGMIYSPTVFSFLSPRM